MAKIVFNQGLLMAIILISIVRCSAPVNSDSNSDEMPANASINGRANYLASAGSFACNGRLVKLKGPDVACDSALNHYTAGTASANQISNDTVAAARAVCIQNKGIWSYLGIDNSAPCYPTVDGFMANGYKVFCCGTMGGTTTNTVSY